MGVPELLICGFAAKYLYIKGCSEGTRQSPNTSTFSPKIGRKIFSPSLNWFQYLLTSCRILPAFSIGRFVLQDCSSSWAVLFLRFQLSLADCLIFSYCQIAAPPNEHAPNPIVKRNGRLNVLHVAGISPLPSSFGISVCFITGPGLPREDGGTFRIKTNF